MNRCRLASGSLAIWTSGVIYIVLYFLPQAEGLGKLVRLVFFHISVAWTSILAFLLSAIWALQYLYTRNPESDGRSAVAAALGLVFCILATVSGAIFARLTWGEYWNWDPRQTTIVVLLLIYSGYLVLRAIIEDVDQKARIAAVYSLVSFIAVPFLMFIIPRDYLSLHPAPIINSTMGVAMDWRFFCVLIAALITCIAIFWELFTCLMNTKCRQQAQGITIAPRRGLRAD